MEEIKGFRADRLRKAMEENEATIADIVKEMLGEQEGYLSKMYSHRFRNIMDDLGFPSIIELRAICKAVNVSADYLLGLSDEMY